MRLKLMEAGDMRQFVRGSACLPRRTHWTDDTSEDASLHSKCDRKLCRLQGPPATSAQAVVCIPVSQEMKTSCQRDKMGDTDLSRLRSTLVCSPSCPFTALQRRSTAVPQRIATMALTAPEVECGGLHGHTDKQGKLRWVILPPHAQGSCPNRCPFTALKQ